MQKASNPPPGADRGRSLAPLRSICPIASTLDVLGDRWSLLVVRDLLFFSKRRFSELEESPEGIPTNILAERLRRLAAAGIVARRAYRERPLRYEYVLTKQGRRLRAVLVALARWGQAHIPGVFTGALPPAAGAAPGDAPAARRTRISGRS